MASTTVARADRPRSSFGLWARRVLPQLALHGALILGAVLVAGPLIWMAISSFKDESDILKYPPSVIPSPFKLENYAIAFSGDYPLVVGYFNSLKVATISTVGTL